MRIVSFEPCFRVRDVDRALEHYGRLGFSTSTHDSTYAFALLDALTIHLMHHDSGAFPPATLFIHVPDADELANEWTAAGVIVIGPVDTDYGLREGSHTDPDGNLLRFGSPLREGAA